MDLFLTKIHINKIFHLEDFDIEIDENQKKHLIITGKNGSGKTQLLNALGEFFQPFFEKSEFSITKKMEIYEEWRGNKKSHLKENSDHNSAFVEFENIKLLKSRFSNASIKIVPKFSNTLNKSIVSNDDFILAFYESKHSTQVIIPKSPEKPNIEPAKKITESKSVEFIKFLVDLKTQESFARNENQVSEADKIKSWFKSFEDLLRVVFEGNSVKLNFDYKNYNFKIHQGKKEFGFDQLSDGYSAIIDIVADLILKMQESDSLTRAYEKQGIVLIDEIETHLHLSLQKTILPFLTKVFPNIQFIVTTHSPFVLNSIPNAVAYDLEKRMRIDDLTEYSYEAIAEGYFGVSNDSSFLRSNLNRFKELTKKEKLDSAEKSELEDLDNEFSKLVSSSLSPKNIVGEYLQMKLAK